MVSQTLRDSRPRMESLLALTRAYRSVERVELTLESLRGLQGQGEIADVAESIYQRFYEAEVRLEAIRAATDLDMLAEIEQLEVEDQLLARRQRLGMAPEQEVPEPPKEADAPAPAEPSPEPEPSPEHPTPDPPTQDPLPDPPEPPPDGGTD